MLKTEEGYTLIVALAKIKTSLENSLVSATLTKNGHMDMHKVMQLVRDLNFVRNLQWKVEQDSKGK
mgnify:CR=1 FL=1